MGEMSVDLARKINDFGENDDVRLLNRVQTYILDDHGRLGSKIYDGTLLSYEPLVTEDGEQFVRCNFFSQSVTLKDRLLKLGSGDTTKTYSTVPVSDIIQDLLNLYNGLISANVNTIDPTPDSPTYTFRYITYFDAIKKCLELAPAYWYWYINPNNLLHLHPVDWDTIDHNLFLGKEISSVNAKKSLEDFYSDVYFLGGKTAGANLYRKYINTSAQDEFKERHYQMRDTRVTTASTADSMANKYLNEHASALSEMTVKVIDQSVDKSKGYDIETFKPGDVVRVTEPQSEFIQSLWDQVDWDDFFWDFDVIESFNQTMQIQSIQYKFDHAVLKLATRPEEIDERINNIDRNLEVLESENVPNAPS